MAVIGTLKDMINDPDAKNKLRDFLAKLPVDQRRDALVKINNDLARKNAKKQLSNPTEVAKRGIKTGASEAGFGTALDSGTQFAAPQAKPSSGRGSNKREFVSEGDGFQNTVVEKQTGDQQKFEAIKKRLFTKQADGTTPVENLIDGPAKPKTKAPVATTAGSTQVTGVIGGAGNFAKIQDRAPRVQDNSDSTVVQPQVAGINRGPQVIMTDKELKKAKKTAEKSKKLDAFIGNTFKGLFKESLSTINTVGGEILSGS